MTSTVPSQDLVSVPAPKPNETIRQYQQRVSDRALLTLVVPADTDDAVVQLGTVLAVTEAGTDVPAGSVVHVSVAAGPAEYVVPDWIGADIGPAMFDGTVREYEGRLEIVVTWRLAVTPEEAYRCVEQTPAPGTVVPRGTTVHLLGATY